MCQLKNVICLITLLLVSAAAKAQQDYISTYAGGGPNNLPATSANVPYPLAVAVDSSGNYYFATDGTRTTTGNRVFKVNTSGTLTVFAGNGFAGYSGDGGPAPQAELDFPTAVAVDSSGNVYIADSYNSIIRKVDTGGTISTFAGTPGNCSYGGDGGAATSAYLCGASGVAVDKSGNVYIADTQNFLIREVTASNGEINTVAGNGSYCTGGGAACGDGGAATSAGMGYVYSLAVDGSGNVYIADYYNYSIREFSVGGKISTVAGNGTYCSGACGDGGLATSAELSYPYAVAVDSPGNIFIADTENYRIREVTVSNGKINTVAGNGTLGYSGDGGAATSAELSDVAGVAVDSSDDIFIADYANLAIREVTASNGYINTVAGNGTYGFAGNEIPATNAALFSTSTPTSDSAGNIYIADFGNCVVREVNARTGIITTIAGTPDSCGYGGDGGPATSAQLNHPTAAVAYAGNVYIADQWNCVIRQVDTTGTITTFAGTPTVCGYGGDGGAASSAYLNYPAGVAVDSSGNVYIADGFNNRIREVSGGIINTEAGNGTQGYAGDGGPATSAELSGAVGVALDASGNLYIADTGNNVVRKVNTAGIISTFAGNGSPGYSGDEGPANQASLNSPEGVAVDAAGDVLIADTFNFCVRWVDGQGFIYTVAGNGFYGFSGDGGLATSAMLTYTPGTGVDPSGNIYIGDTDNNRVRMVSAVAGLNASTTSVTFGSQGVGTASSPQSVTLAAIGPLDISGIVVTGDFSESGDCATGEMSEQCVLSIVFKPTGAGTRTGTVTISDNGYFSPSLVINLQGTGTGPWVSLSASSLTFPPQIVGTNSSPQTIMLTNTGNASLAISSIVTGGDFAQTNTCGTSMCAGACKGISVIFKPRGPGVRTGTLMILDNATGSPQTVTLSGTGLAFTVGPHPPVVGRPPSHPVPEQPKPPSGGATEGETRP